MQLLGTVEKEILGGDIYEPVMKIKGGIKSRYKERSSYYSCH
jgi:hypothetical protein